MKRTWVLGLAALCFSACGGTLGPSTAKVAEPAVAVSASAPAAAEPDRTKPPAPGTARPFAPPAEQRLTLPRSAFQVSRVAVFLYLLGVSSDREPSLDLPVVLLRQSASHIVPTIPLEPTPRVLGINPPVTTPHGQRLTGIYSKIIKFRITLVCGKFGIFKPIHRKFFFAVRHVLTSEDTELEHLLGSQFRLKTRIKFRSRLCRQNVMVILLHSVVHDDRFWHEKLFQKASEHPGRFFVYLQSLSQKVHRHLVLSFFGNRKH